MIRSRSEPRYVFAVDVGGTSMRAGVVDIDGSVVARAVTSTEPERGIADAAQRLVGLLGTVSTAVGATVRAKVEGVGIATAGPVDSTSGIYLHPPNLPGWHGASMRPAIEAAFALPLAIGHDATLAARAEVAFGAHQGARDLVYLTISTGIGAGIIADARSTTGHAGGAGEAGHMIVYPGGASCNVGCSGCLEGTASGTGIAAAARRALSDGVTTVLPPDPSAVDVFGAATAGDPVAISIIDGVVGGLAIGLANLLALLDPEVIVLGGGVVQSLETRWDELLTRTRAAALPRYAEGVPVERTTLGDDASLLGAALIAFEAAARTT